MKCTYNISIVMTDLTHPSRYLCLALSYRMVESVVTYNIRNRRNYIVRRYSWLVTMFLKVILHCRCVV